MSRAAATVAGTRRCGVGALASRVTRGGAARTTKTVAAARRCAFWTERVCERSTCAFPPLPSAPQNETPRACGAWQANCFPTFVTNAPNNPTPGNSDFERELKWCDACKKSVRFLMSVNHSFCVHCGGRVRLFNREERTRFAETVQRHKWQAS